MGGTKILIIGGTGYIGKFIVKASTTMGHPTFALVRESTVSDPAKAEIIKSFKSWDVTLLHGSLEDHASLVAAIKQVDVVISALGHDLVADQLKIIAAIKEAGTLKRFLPSEYGNDVDRVRGVEPAKSLFEAKARIRRAVEAAGIPYTIVSSNFFAGTFLPSLAQPNRAGPPKDKVVIVGDGNVKAVFVNEDDIGSYAIKAVDDPRTLNKVLYVRPPGNICTLNELISLWEKKVGKNFERIYVPEEELIKNLEEIEYPESLVWAVSHSAFIKGDHLNFDIEESFGVEASQLYPDIKYTTVSEYLDQFVC